MEDSRVEFPGFQTCSHRDEFEFRKCMSRLQKRAPCPLQLKPNVISSACSGLQNSCSRSSSSSSSSTSSSSSSDSFFSRKDPIPLLSPLVVFVEYPPLSEKQTLQNPIN